MGEPKRTPDLFSSALRQMYRWQKRRDELLEELCDLEQKIRRTDLILTEFSDALMTDIRLDELLEEDEEE